MKKLSEGFWGWGKGGVVRCGAVGRWEVIWRFSGQWGGGREGGLGVGGRGLERGGEGRGDTVDSRMCVGKAESGEVLRKGEDGIEDEH